MIWATGYSFDYDWLHAPCLYTSGEPIQHRGVTDLEGLYFLGLLDAHIQVRDLSRHRRRRGTCRKPPDRTSPPTVNNPDHHTHRSSSASPSSAPRAPRQVRQLAAYWRGEEEVGLSITLRGRSWTTPWSSC